MRSTPTENPVSSPATDPPEVREARNALVTQIAARRPHVSPRVLEAMRAVPRHLFVDAPIEEAYRDRILRIGWGQTISQPSVVAVMTSALELTGSERVLEIGTGCGYQAAVLSKLAAHVDTIEILAPLGEAARNRLGRLGFSNIDVRVGDGYLGWPERAPYDRVLLTAAPERIPDALRTQLADGGILVAPVGPERNQRLVRWRARGGELAEEDLGPIRFVPMVHE
jgi:protein-L-isoaspartate(D-aspartate) O-methyltransferase